MTVTIPTADLMRFSARELLTKIEELTHKLHELSPYNGTGPGAARIAETRALREHAEAELIRRSDAVERALVVVETHERLLRGMDKTLADLDPTEDHNVESLVAQHREAIDMLTERSTTLTCSLVKDQDTSDRIAAAAREEVAKITERVIEVHDSMETE